MARRKQFGQLTERNREKIVQDGARYGLTRRQTRERYNRGTYNPLSKNPAKNIPAKAPHYPVESGNALKKAAIDNMDAKLHDHVNKYGEIATYNRFAVLDAVEKHASDAALRRMAGASEDELTAWASYQKPRSFEGKETPEFVRSLGWHDGGKWHNVFWYHLCARRPLYLRIRASLRMVQRFLDRAHAC